VSSFCLQQKVDLHVPGYNCLSCFEQMERRVNYGYGSPRPLLARLSTLGGLSWLSLKCINRGPFKTGIKGINLESNPYMCSREQETIAVLQ